MLKSKTQTPVFDAATKVQESLNLEPKTKTDLEEIMLLIDNSDYVITIDGGGSKTSVQVLDTHTMQVVDLNIDGAITKAFIVGPTNINVVGFDEAQNNLKKLITVLSKVKFEFNKVDLAKIDKKSIVCGLAGILSNADKKPAIIDIFKTLGVMDKQIYLAGDLDIAKQIISEEGAILISGTGSICFSKSSGIEKRIGGYGYALGDEGSGFYIGKLALRAALDAKFQHRKPFVLTEKLCELLHLDSINEAIKAFYAGSINAAHVAKITPFVFMAAFQQNDPVCKEIIELAAVELAKHITYAVEGSSKPNFPVYLIGGIFKNDNADAFIEMIRKQVPYSLGLDFINLAQQNIVMQMILSQAKIAQVPGSLLKN